MSANTFCKTLERVPLKSVVGFSKLLWFLGLVVNCRNTLYWNWHQKYEYYKHLCWMTCNYLWFISRHTLLIKILLRWGYNYCMHYVLYCLFHSLFCYRQTQVLGCLNLGRDGQQKFLTLPGTCLTYLYSH